MNARERTLAIILILLMVGAAGGAGFWQLILTPYRKNEQEIAKIRKEIADLGAQKLQVEEQARVYETKTRKMSLPADFAFARKEYSHLLSSLLRKADFETAETKISSKDPSTTQVPLIGPKKPAYTKLDFDVTVKGNLTSLVDFLYNFYRQPLLHQIVRFTIVKPSGGRGRAGDLDITLLVQAIVLDKAEDRSVLLATVPSVTLLGGGSASLAYNKRSIDGLGSPFTAADVLARVGDRAAHRGVTPLQEYSRIASKNIFFGPPIVPKKEKESPEPKTREIDLSPYLKLISVTHDDYGAGQAVIFDFYRKDYYEMEQDRKGDIRIVKYYYDTRPEFGVVLEIKKRYPEDQYDTRYLTFGSAETGNERAFRVRRILESDIIIEPFIEGRGGLMKGAVPAVLGGSAALALPGKLYAWHVGQVLRSEVEGQAPVELSTTESRRALMRPLNITNGNASPPAAELPKKRPGL